MSPLLLVAIGVLAATAAWAILEALGRRAPGLGLVDVPGERKVHAGAVPLVGGTALLVALACGLAASSALSSLTPQSTLWAAGLTALYAIGLWDDWAGKEMAASTKAVATAVVLVSWSLAMGAGAGATLVAFLVLHSFNTSDNMNGLAGGLALGSLGVLGVTAGAAVLPDGGVASLALAAGLVVFLRQNFPRARVFLGDSGSLLLGGWFASLWLLERDPALLCFAAVPLGDLVGMSVRRLGRGRAPWVGDRDHLSHRLATWVGPRAGVLLLVALQLVASTVGWWHRGEPSGTVAALTSVAGVALLTLGLPPRR